MADVTIARAAGGLVWREGPSGPRLALVHRPRRNDWSFPKGKLDDGESWEAAALREVEEETGCEARITGFAGAVSYVARRGPKLVLYWHMELVREGRLDAGDEIDEVAWLTPAAALSRLDYEQDRRLLARVAPGGARPAAGPAAAEVAAERAGVLRRILALGSASDGPGLGPALDLLDLADAAASRGDRRDARLLVLAAGRLALLSADDEERAARARALREEAKRLAPWRRDAVRSLLPRGERVSAEALHVATAIRDEEDRAAEPPRPSRRAAIASATGIAALGTAGLAAGWALRAPPAALLGGAAAGALAWAAVALAELWATGRGGPRR